MPDGIGDHFQIDTRGGDDNVAVQDLLLFGDVEIDAGSGNDDVLFELSTAQELSLSLGRGDDVVDIQNTEMIDDLQIQMQGGNDMVIFEDSTVGGDFFFDQFSPEQRQRVLAVDAARDRRTITLTGVEVGGGLTLANLNSTDRVTITDSDFGGLIELDTGKKKDRIVLTNVNAVGGTAILTGAGGDMVTLDGVRFRRAGGRALGLLEAGTIDVLLSGGKDQLTLVGVDGNVLNADGGAGKDTYTDGGDNNIKKLSLKKFETEQRQR